MKLHILWIVGLTLCLMGCAEKEQASPEQNDMTGMNAPPPEPAAAEEKSVADEAFIQHMHEHAEKLDDLNFSLSDEDLETAKMSAYWLSRHETVSGVPADLQIYVTGMRDAASAVENAPDLEIARAASERISQQCQNCHAAAGI